MFDVGVVALIVLVVLAVLVHRSAREVPAAAHWLRTAGLLVMVGYAGLWFVLGIGLMLSGHVAGAWHAVPGTVALVLGVVSFRRLAWGGTVLMVVGAVAFVAATAWLSVYAALSGGFGQVLRIAAFVGAPLGTAGFLFRFAAREAAKQRPARQRDGPRRHTRA